MARRRSDPRIDLLLEALESAFRTRSWHGTTLRGSLRGLKPDTATWSPGADRPSIWALLLHAAYWKYAARRKLIDTDEAAEATFPRSPSDWPAPPERPMAKALREDVALLVDEHERLLDAVQRFPASRLDEPCGRTGVSYAGLIHGVAFHDVHHGGQIQQIKRLWAARGQRSTTR